MCKIIAQGNTRGTRRGTVRRGEGDGEWEGESAKSPHTVPPTLTQQNYNAHTRRTHTHAHTNTLSSRLRPCFVGTIKASHNTQHTRTYTYKHQSLTSRFPFTLGCGFNLFGTTKAISSQHTEYTHTLLSTKFEEAAR